MNGVSNALVAWGYGSAALAYLLLAVMVGLQGYAKAPVNKPGVAILLAASLTGVWAVFSLVALSLTGWWVWSAVADICRYAAWFAFVVHLFRAGAEQGRNADVAPWMLPLAVALPVLSLLSLMFTAIWFKGGADAPVGLFLTLMLLAVLGLVLVEQLFRNLPEDALWSAKPICLGLAGTFLFDLYLFSQAVLFNGIDMDAWNIRGLVHAALMPLFLLSTTRHRDWISKIRVSRKVVFHSATLLMAGGYLLFIAGVGYYVRYFGSDWGRSLQLAMVFLALMLLVALAL